jgi:NADPH:quinone reductase-like Zn-dependent oxidoreductase
MMKAVRYDRFSGVDGIYLADVPEPVAGLDEVVVRLEAGALNPGALPALHGSSYTPGRDLAGEVVAVGADVLGFTVGDAVLGWLQSWDAHAQFVAIPAAQLMSKPQALSWDVAGSLYTTPMAGLGAIRAVEPRPGETIVISGASGGVGFTAAQLALRAGATVIGLTSDSHVDLLRRYRIEPVQYGDGEQERILATTDRVDAFIDAVGGGYIDLAINLGVPTTARSTGASCCIPKISSELPWSHIRSCRIESRCRFPLEPVLAMNHKQIDSVVVPNRKR